MLLLLQTTLLILCGLCSVGCNGVGAEDDWSSTAHGAARSLLQGNGSPKSVVEEPIKKGRFPYIVSLRNSFGHVCTGALVDPSWVVVAAQCVAGGDASTFTVALDTVDIDDTSNVIKVIDIQYPPPHTGNPASGGDVSLLRLENPTELTTVSIPDPNFKPRGLDPLFGLGWNTLKGPAKIMGFQRNGAVPNVNCEDAWEMKMEASMSCISARIDEVCKGERTSGVLMLVNKFYEGINEGRPDLDLLAGVMSFRQDPCELGTKPAIYTNVATFRDWARSLFKNPPPLPGTSTTLPTIGFRNGGVSEFGGDGANAFSGDVGNFNSEEAPAADLVGGESQGSDGSGFPTFGGR
ncbi:hypothetical protein BSKO_08078 [Bryopsis sp. KO-2023]|nr:hypothetical protein BSKO_08078 [Bryopsis sp. KO-2023]